MCSFLHRFTHPQAAPTAAPTDATRTDAQMRLEEVGALIEALDAVSRDELPNGATRLALTRAIVAGEIDALYRPHGATAHNVCLSGLPADVDPRMTVAQWVMCWRASVPARVVLISATYAHRSIADALSVAGIAPTLAPTDAGTDAGTDAPTDAEGGR